MNLYDFLTVNEYSRQLFNETDRSNQESKVIVILVLFCSFFLTKQFCIDMCPYSKSHTIRYIEREREMTSENSRKGGQKIRKMFKDGSKAIENKRLEVLRKYILN